MSAGRLSSRGSVRRVRAGIVRLIPVSVALLLWAGLLTPPVRQAIGAASVTPLPGFIGGAVDALVQVVNAVRWAAPFVAVTALVWFGWVSLVATRSPRGRIMNRLSTVEYAGIDHVDRVSVSRSRPVRIVTDFVGGTGLAVLAVVLVGATSGIEHEVTNGPLRPVDALTRLVGLGSGDNVTYIFQSPEITFMDDSAIPVDAMSRLVAASGATVIPFGKYLFNLDGKSALELSVPQNVYDRIADAPQSGPCTGLPIDSVWVAHLVSRLQIDDVLDAPASRVSGGQAQRAALVRSLAHRPPVVFADEPTASLDTAATHLVHQLLREISLSEGTTTLMVSHDEVSTQYATHTALLVDGRLQPPN